MHIKKLGGDGEQSYAIVFGEGEEMIKGLLDFQKRTRIVAAQFQAIGGFSDVVLGYFDMVSRHYLPIPLDEQVEVVSLLGDVAVDPAGEPQVHAHAVVARRDGTTRGGHLLRARVRPTLETILTQSPRYLRRRFDPATGLALLFDWS